MTLPDVKICGLTRRADAEVVAASGARYAGVILAPGGKRTVTPRAAASLLSGLSLRRVGIFVDAAPDQALRDADAAGLDVLQLHGEESVGTVRALRGEGGRAVWKAVRVREPSDLGRAVDRYGADVDGILLDGWSPDAPGGAGVSFDWEALAAERERVPGTLPLIVAGGLTARNVGWAVTLLRPDVVDVSSGVEHSPGVKDPEAIPAFVEAARARPL